MKRSKRISAVVMASMTGLTCGFYAKAKGAELPGEPVPGVVGPATPEPQILSKDSDLATLLDKEKILGYFGGGAGKSQAFYSSDSQSEGSWKLFAGARGKYFGVELDYNKLSKITATISSTLVTVNTDAYSLSLLGYLPLGRSADLFLKYGGVYWNVNADSQSTGNLPVKDGFDGVYGVGLELRPADIFFVRVEWEVFNKVYVSDRYTFLGIGLGMYFAN